MIKKTVTYESFDEPPQMVTEDFYFSFNKLEVMEMLELDNLEARIDQLTKTQNAREAYELFKKIILDGYGVRSDDKRRFVKSPEARSDLEHSPALAEIIIEFLQKPEEGAKFIEGTLPPKLVQEAKDAQALKDAGESPEIPTEAPVLEGEKKWEAYSRTELVEMPQEEFDKLVGTTDPQKMSHDQLMIAMQRRSQA